MEWSRRLTVTSPTQYYKANLQSQQRQNLSKLGDAKLLGGIGSILLFVPGVNLVGFILILIATKFVSDEVGDKKIFDDMIYAVAAAIIGFAVGAFSLFTGLLTGIFTLGAGALIGVVAGLVVIWAFLIVSAYFIRRAYDSMAVHLGVDSFKTAGMLYFIGALLTVVLVGFLVLFIAFIFQIIAFFSIRETLQPQGGQSMPPPPSGAPQTTGGVKFCPYCGTQVSSSSMFCPKCGAKIS